MGGDFERIRQDRETMPTAFLYFFLLSYGKQKSNESSSVDKWLRYQTKTAIKNFFYKCAKDETSRLHDQI